MATDAELIVRAARAVALRRLATKLELSGAAGLTGYAGDSTWLGPTADACRTELDVHATAIAGACAWLRARARQLDPVTGGGH